MEDADTRGTDDPHISGLDTEEPGCSGDCLSDGALETGTERFGGLADCSRLGVEGLLDPPGDRPDPGEVEIPVGFGELGQVGPWQVAHPSGTTVT